jgi:hypothetical protein
LKLKENILNILQAYTDDSVEQSREYLEHPQDGEFEHSYSHTSNS